MGRKAKLPLDRKSYCLRVMLTEEQRIKIEQAARVAGLDPSAWVRSMAVAAAARAKAVK